VGDCRVGSQLPDELIAVHRRHQDVANDKVRTLGARIGQGFEAV